ncbi:MAG: hypothetical protein KAS32_22390, partial [Candidatus Peribacteraceae bacterium]|nr:hypothetical protein [Candidatus Peribacteraceae bacterium]
VQSALTDVGVDKSFFSTLEKAIRVDLKKTDSGFVGEFDGKELPVKEYVQEFMKDKSQFITRETPGGGGPPDKSTPNGKRFMKKSDAAFLEKMNAKTKK